MTTRPAGPAFDPRHLAAQAGLRALIDANWTTQAIAAAVQLKLPEMLADQPQTVDTLARQASCHGPSLVRLLRALTSIGIVLELPDGRFTLTDMGSLLSADVPGSMAAWAELCGTSSWAAWARLRSCVQSGHSVRKQSNGADGFEHLEQDAAAALLFNRAMVSVSGPVAAEVASEVDFAGVQRVVDVGGGWGELLAAVLGAYPDMQGVLFDLAHAIDAAHDRLAVAGVVNRCQLVVGSFFDAVPKGADAYMLKSILHDWNDDRCATILAKCAEAMPPHGHLLIVERLMPEHFAVTAHDQGIARGDLNMLVAQDGRERTLEEYCALLFSAGLRLTETLTLHVGFTVLVAVRA